MQKGNPWALLPIAVFLVVFIGCGILFGDFYAMPAIVGFLIALVTAFLQNPKRTFAEKLSSVTRSMGDENVMIMCLVFVWPAPFPARFRQRAAWTAPLISVCRSFRLRLPSRACS